MIIVSIPYQKIEKALRKEQNEILVNLYQNDYQDFQKTDLRRSWSAPPTPPRNTDVLLPLPAALDCPSAQLRLQLVLVQLVLVQ